MIDQGELFTINNPCIGVCTTNSKGYCLGCLRSRQERYHWNSMTSFQQQLVVNLCNKRRLKIQSQNSPQISDNASDLLNDATQGDLF